MASPQLEKGYIRIANEILEALAKSGVYGRGSSNGQVIFAILRKTYGWHKKEDKISISQLEEITGLSRRTVIYSLQDLESKKVIFITRKIKNGRKDTNVIKFNKNYDDWVVQNSAPSVKQNRRNSKLRSAKLRTTQGGSAKSYNGVVNSFAHTKDSNILTKDKVTNQSMGVDFKKDCLKSLGVKRKVKSNDFSKSSTAKVNGGNCLRIIDEIVNVTNDGKSVPFWTKAYNKLGEGILEEELGELKYQIRMGTINCPAKYFVRLLKKRMGVMV